MCSQHARPPAQEKKGEKGKEKLVVPFDFVNLIPAASSGKRDLR